MTQPTIAQLHNLINRAGHGLTPDEQARLRDGIDQLDRIEAERDELRDEIATAGAKLADMARSRSEWEWRAGDAERRVRCQRERAETAEAANDQAEEAARRALAQRQEMAEERYAWQERGDRAETALAEARRLHAQTCLLAQGVARPPAFTCSLCTALTAPARETT